MRFSYLNTENLYPQDKHLIKGLRELGHSVDEIYEKGGIKGSLRLMKRLKSETSESDAIIAGFIHPLFAIAASLATRKRVIFNANSSQYEANIVSRREYGLLGYRIAKWWLVDFLSFHLSSKVLLESKAQMDYVNRLFFVPRRKLVLSYSGVSEDDFHPDPTVDKNPDFTVLFRGRFLPESGILTVIEAAKRLEGSGVKFLVIGHGFMYREVGKAMRDLHPENLTIISEKLPISDLRRLMLGCHVSLGQMADHPRLARTLPCKLFESLALGLPYVTGRNKAAMELLADGQTCIAVNPNDPEDLAHAILSLEKDRALLKRIGDAGNRLFMERLTSKKLAADVLASISI